MQKITPFSKKTKAEKYLEWVNDWLTIEAFADNYGRSVEEMKQLIKEGRGEHEENVMKYKNSLKH